MYACACSHDIFRILRYVFDAKILHMAPALSSGLPVPELFVRHPSVLKQFILGPRGSGAYPHFHNAAANALVHGEKRWWLFPPGVAFFDVRHIKKWSSDAVLGLPAIANSTVEGKRVLECVQRAGEVMVLPDMWGHAVYNTKDSIGVAYEFHGSLVDEEHDETDADRGMPRG